jgi:hypothetical protein
MYHQPARSEKEESFLFNRLKGGAEQARGFVGGWLDIL